MSEKNIEETWAIVEVMGHQVYAGHVSQDATGIVQALLLAACVELLEPE